MAASLSEAAESRYLGRRATRLVVIWLGAAVLAVAVRAQRGNLKEPLGRVTLPRSGLLSGEDVFGGCFFVTRPGFTRGA